ncbi:MAG: hypothetical protein AAFV53_33975, partial [Myxococcota bacterium]
MDITTDTFHAVLDKASETSAFGTLMQWMESAYLHDPAHTTQTLIPIALSVLSSWPDQDRDWWLDDWPTPHPLWALIRQVSVEWVDNDLSRFLCSPDSDHLTALD